MCDDTLSVPFVLVLDVVSFGGAMRGQANACSMSGAPRGTVPSGPDVMCPRAPRDRRWSCQTGRARAAPRRGLPSALGACGPSRSLRFAGPSPTATERKNRRKTFRSTKNITLDGTGRYGVPCIGEPSERVLESSRVPRGPAAGHRRLRAAAEPPAERTYMCSQVS